MQAHNSVKPKSVSTAINLLWANLALSPIGIFLNFAAVEQGASAAQGIGGMGFLVSVMLISLGFIAFLISKVSAGRNWARILFSIFFVFGLFSSLSTLSGAFSAAPLAGVVTVAGFALQGFALYLLFTNPGSSWFSKVAPVGLDNQPQQSRPVHSRQAKFCSGCGDAFEAGVAFCSNCGKQLA